MLLEENCLRNLLFSRNHSGYTLHFIVFLNQHRRPWSLLLCLPVIYVFLLHSTACACAFYACPYTEFYFCLSLRSGRSSVLWVGTSAMSLTTVTGSALCSTLSSTASILPSLGTHSFISRVGSPAHICLQHTPMSINASDRLIYLGLSMREESPT